MAAGDVPDGLPQPNPSPSYWQLPSYSKASHRSTPELPTKRAVNFVIIGSGISGAAIALKMMAGNMAGEVLMLEARTAASGGSTRHGAHCHAGWWVNFKENVQKYGEEEALKIEDMEERSMMELEHFIKYFDVECDYEDVEAVDAFKGPVQSEEIEDILRLRREAFTRRGITIRRPRVLRRDQHAEKHLGMTLGKGVTVSYRTFTLNPYFFICRLLERCLAQKENPLNLQTNTPVYAIRAASPSKYDGARWEVETSRGTARAHNVILATDGYTNALSSEIASTRFLNPSVDVSVALRHTTGWEFRPFAMNRSVCVPTSTSGEHYYMIRAPRLAGGGDLILSSRGCYPDVMSTQDDKVPNNIAAGYYEEIAGIFGVAKAEITDKIIWSGISGFTPDSFPLVGGVPGKPGLFASVGMNGHGLGVAYGCATALVNIIQRRTHLKWFPRSFRIARAWRGQAEDGYATEPSADENDGLRGLYDE